ncbi:MAG: sensor histidine kinase [Paracoccaceae bacterium]
MAALAWNALGDDQFNEGLFQRSATLVEMLLPAGTASQAVQEEVLRDVAGRLDFNASLYEPSGLLIAETDKSVPWVEPTVGPGEWQTMDSQRQWLTQLPDGRVLLLELNRGPLPNEMLAVTLTFGVLAIVIAGFIYPITRRVTLRLERLQKDVDQIGPENLSARLTVDGNDEIAKLAQSFNRSTETIEDLVNRQRLFVANASHELRTPLARIRMGVELLETKNTEERRDELRRDIRELDALIDDLITMARYDAGFSRDGWESVDLLELAKEECEHVDECEVNGNSVVVDGDRRMLQHLLRNLIDNARLHGAAPITVDVGQDEHGPSLAVRDAGPGIPESDRGKVFEPFFRGRGKQNKDGYGLGLPLVARIATLHGAAVRVSSHPQSEVAVQFA